MLFRTKLLVALLPLAVLSAGSLVAHGSPCAISSFFISNARADNCTGWMKQSNGCSERVCVDNKGNRYCQESCKGRVNRVRC